jgi:hypothetical protein
MLHNPSQQYMMYPMMDQSFQWKQPNQVSVDSARASKSHGHSKSSSHEKELKNKKFNKNVQNQQQMINQAAMNQFVPVYMLPPGFTGHPGAFNAALAAHQAGQNTNSPYHQLAQAQQHAAHAHNNSQMPTYGHNIYQQPYGGFYGYPTNNNQHKNYYPNSGYTGSDYNSGSGHDSSVRNSKSSDSGKMEKMRKSGSLTSKDSGHSNNSSTKKGSTIKKPTGKKNNNVKKFQSTHQIVIQKGPKKPIKQQQSCGRSHSTGSDLSAGCSASNCPPATVNRVCSHDSDNSNNNIAPIQNDTKLVSNNNSINSSTVSNTLSNKSGVCCSTDCDHHGPIFENMRKFSNNQDFKKPDNELTKKLIELIEFYLSDEYLAKDKYLLRQIRCKSEGYISIKLMTSFKKVKKLTRDWRSVRFALQQSPNLIVSPEGFRVKRATQLPENLRKPRLLSSVVTIRLTEELSSVDAITNMFSKYGEIGLVRILKPGKEIPSDLRNYATQVPDIGKSMCAVVDFEQSESALQAVRLLKDDLVEQKMRLALLGPRVRRTLYKQDKDGNDIIDDEEDENTDINNNAINNIEPTTNIKPILKNNSSTESNTHSNHSLDLSIDSGNCGISSGHMSENEHPVDIKHVVFNVKDDNSQHQNKQPLLKRENSINNQEIIIINNKISTIFREPEGPGSTNTNGFSIKRSQKTN